MRKEMTVEELMANLKAFAEHVRRREDEHAGSEPPMRFIHRGVPYPFRDFDFGARPKNLRTDPAEIIIEERERERSGQKHRL